MTAVINLEKNLVTKASSPRIEKGIPLPKYTKMHSGKNELADDLKKMKVGDSRLLDVEASKKSLNAMRTRISTLQKNHGIEAFKFTVNVDPKTESDPNVVTKLRVWRVA